MGITITEALAEIKTIQKRLASKREFIKANLVRHEGLKDPLERDGGSFQLISRERQAIGDLENRIVTLRRGIQTANEESVVTINGTSRSVADWLVWRRDVAPGLKEFLAMMQGRLNSVREEARRQGSSVVSNSSEAQKPTDLIVNINEQGLAKEREMLEDTLGQLDGQLSLKNATIQLAA